MREIFHSELDSLATRLVEMTNLVADAVAHSTKALLEADLALAESVIAGDRQVDQLQQEVDDIAVELLARQQPVATDLRVVVASLRMSATLERMGDLARHVSKLARLRYPHEAIPIELRSTFAEMGLTAEGLARKAGRVITTRDLAVGAEIERDDDELDRLHRSVFTTMLSGDWDHSAETTVDVTLCSRFLERFGDHAVSLARRMGFLVTGEWAPVSP